MIARTSSRSNTHTAWQGAAPPLRRLLLYVAKSCSDLLLIPPLRPPLEFGCRVIWMEMHGGQWARWLVRAAVVAAAAPAGRPGPATVRELELEIDRPNWQAAE